LTASNVDGSNTSTQNNFVVVTAAPSQPNISQNGNILSVFLQLGETATWYLNGTIVGTGNSITITTPGNYTVEVINDSGCRAMSDLFNVLSNEVFAIPEITIYPIPSDGLIYIDMPVTTGELIVLDLQGRVVYQSGTTGGSFELNLQHLSTGSYVVRIVSDMITSIHQIQIVH